ADCAQGPTRTHSLGDRPRWRPTGRRRGSRRNSGGSGTDKRRNRAEGYRPAKGGGAGEGPDRQSPRGNRRERHPGGEATPDQPKVSTNEDEGIWIARRGRRRMTRMNRRVPLPTLGPEPRPSRAPKLLLFLLVLGAAFGWWWWRRHRAPIVAEQRPATAPGAIASNPTAAEPAPAKAPVLPDPLKQSGMQRVSVTLQGPLETPLVETRGGDLGQTVGQEVSRTLVWWVAVPGGLIRGDKLDVLFETRQHEEPIIHVIHFNSGKRGQTYAAYRFKAPEAQFARYYLPSSEELEL